MTEEFGPTVLLITNDEKLKISLNSTLERHSFNVIEGSSGSEATALCEQHKPDIIILDSQLPDLPGIGVCTILRTKAASKNLPIIMLSDNEGEFDRVKGLDSGVDDYIVKPFQPNELVARIKAIFRRIRPSFNSKSLNYKDLKMDMASYRVTRGIRDIHLGPTEFRILQCLMEFPKRILSREYIMTHVWGYESQVEPRTIDVHINRLRSALKNDNEDLPFIKTIRSAGYCLGGPGTE
jgi:two-component system phosphate regulon response regulator PhoB